jgi:diguanylate cyclase (GGDEF)-like protein
LAQEFVVETSSSDVKKIKIRRLHTRIMIAFAVFLLAVQVVNLALTNVVLTNNAHEQIRQSLRIGEGVFSELRTDNSQQLSEVAGVLSSDFAFREAVGTADRDTVMSALVNHGARIHADVMMLVGVDYKVIADTSSASVAGTAFPFTDLIRQAEQRQRATAMVVVNGKLYQLVVVPVLAPLPIAWLAIGFAIDNRFAMKLQSLAALDVSFATQRREGEPWQVLVTTVPPEVAVALSAVLAQVSTAQSGDVVDFNVNGENFIALVSHLDTQNRQGVITLLQRSERQALSPLRHLQVILLSLTAMLLVIAVVASSWMARGITRPISALSAQADRISEGDYSPAIDVERDDEIGTLATAFNNMSAGIAAREARISDLAYSDQLTGLPNRVLFNDRLGQLFKASRRSEKTFSVLMMDLDRFKEVNDALGHHVGDLLLQEVARRLMTVVRRDTDTVARLGGDEFAILLPDSDVPGAEIVAGKVIEVLERPILLEEQNIVATGSIGIASYPEHGDEIGALMRRADQAMYRAKRNGSGYTVFGPTDETHDQQRLSLMAELRNAVETDQLRLYYQPKINMADGTVGHVEALIRWVHPQRGTIPPHEFIPFAEKTGYIRTISEWVIVAALRQRKAWLRQGMPLTIAVNISARDLMNAELPEFVAAQMATYGAPPSAIALEITESAIMADPLRALEVLDRLHAMGLTLSVDDFGIGHSSLAYLKRLPVSELKIDQSFVIAMESGSDDHIIVRSTVDLGHNMGLKVVAEGVETERAWGLLKDMGCDMAQGYYLSRPMESDQLPSWIAQSPWTLREDT